MVLCAIMISLLTLFTWVGMTNYSTCHHALSYEPIQNGPLRRVACVRVFLGMPTHYHSLLSLSIMHSITLAVSPCLSFIPRLGSAAPLALANSGTGLLNMINGPNDSDVPHVPASGVTPLMAYTLSSAFAYYYGQMGKGRIYENSFPFSSSVRLLTLHNVSYYDSKSWRSPYMSSKGHGWYFTCTSGNRFSLMPNLHLHKIVFFKKVKCFGEMMWIRF